MELKLSNGNVLIHEHAPYNAAEAHKYYEEHRKLHPRQRHASFTVTNADGVSVRVSAKELAEEKAYAAKRVNSIRTRLSKLNQELKNKLADAKKSAEASKQPKTAADKAKEAKDSKAYRDKNKTLLANKAKEKAAKEKSSSTGSDKTKSGTTKHVDTADDLKVKIAAAKSNLNQAIARQRSLATAKKNG